MKKFLVFTVVAAMLAVVVPFGAFAADSSGLETAIQSVKQRISIPDECTEFSSDVYDNSGTKEYQLHWSTPYEEYTEMKSVSVTVNEKGDIISYRGVDNTENTTPGFAVLTSEEMKKAAEDWLKKINPSWSDELPSDKAEVKDYGVYDNAGHIYFKRYLNGLELASDSINMSVNNKTGEIVNMYADWTYSDNIPKEADKKISGEDAGKLFLKNSPMQLKYILVRDENKAVPVYMPKKPFYGIDANTGEEFKEFAFMRGDMSASGGSNMKNEAAADKEGSAGYTESELKNLDEIKELLSQEELRKIAEGLENTDISTADFDFCKYSKNSFYRQSADNNAKYIAYLRYIGKDVNYRIRLDAKTGELLSYYSYEMTAYPNKEEEKTGIGYDKVLKAASEFAEKYSGCKGHIRAEEITDEEKENVPDYVYFNRYENGIIYDSNSVVVSVNPKTGRVRSYSKYWENDITFEKPENLISEEDAGEILIDSLGMTLTYAKKQGESKTVPQIGLRYGLNTEKPYIVDAKSGEILNFSGASYDPSVQQMQYPTDIAGHYAENKINKLIEAEVIELPKDETEFRPDDVITVRELLSFVAGLKTGRVPYNTDDEYIAKVVTGWGLKIDSSMDLEKPAQRSDGAEYIVRVLGYSDIADIKGIFATGFADDAEISEDTKGYVAIAKGLKIVGGDENNRFSPNTELTRADAAIMLYNYLAR